MAKRSAKRRTIELDDTHEDLVFFVAGGRYLKPTHSYAIATKFAVVESIRMRAAVTIDVRAFSKYGALAWGGEQAAKRYDPNDPVIEQLVVRATSKVGRHSACAPGCKGWFENVETKVIEACDECRRFVTREGHSDDAMAQRFARAHARARASKKGKGKRG